MLAEIYLWGIDSGWFSSLSLFGCAYCLYKAFSEYASYFYAQKTKRGADKVVEYLNKTKCDVEQIDTNKQLKSYIDQIPDVLSYDIQIEVGEACIEHQFLFEVDKCIPIIKQIKSQKPCNDVDDLKRKLTTQIDNAIAKLKQYHM